MKNLSVVCGVLVGLLWALTAQGAETGLIFAFKYAPHQAASWSVNSNMAMDMKIKAGGENVNMKMAFTIRYHVKLTPTGETKDGVSTVLMEPSDIEGDWDISGSGNHIILTLRGSDMTGTNNGKVMIDTAKGIGAEEAEGFKKEIAPFYLSGKLDVDAAGNVKKFYGDPSFVEFWTETMQAQLGIWGIVFPQTAVSVGESWKENLALKKMGQVKLDGAGLQCSMGFTRQADVVSDGKTFAVFSLNAPFSQKNLAGSLEQAGQKIRLNISQFDRKATGTMQFDRETGLLSDATLKADGAAAMNATVQGQAMSMNVDLQMTNTIKLLAE